MQIHLSSDVVTVIWWPGCLLLIFWLTSTWKCHDNASKSRVWRFLKIQRWESQVVSQVSSHPKSSNLLFQFQRFWMWMIVAEWCFPSHVKNLPNPHCDNALSTTTCNMCSREEFYGGNAKGDMSWDRLWNILPDWWLQCLHHVFRDDKGWQCSILSQKVCYLKLIFKLRNYLLELFSTW